MSGTIRVVVADDHPLWRKAATDILQEIPGLALVGTAENAEELLRLCESRKPDLVITDLKMPGMQQHVLGKIAFSSPPIIVLVVSAVEEEMEMLKVLASGAKGFIGKHADLYEISQAILAVTTRNEYYCKFRNEHLASMIRQYSYPNLPQQEHLFTAREWDVLQGMLQQRTSAQIGEALHITEKTVNGHRNNLMKKTSSKNAIGVIIYALKNGWIRLTE